jgi:hypothetical protein
MEETNQVPERPAGPAKRRVLTWSLVAAGLLGGGMLAGALPAGAQTATEAPAATTTPDAEKPDRARDGKNCPDKDGAERTGKADETTA